MSNLKQIRKVHYTLKTLSTSKHTSSYEPPKKLPEQAIYLLDIWIPSASAKQLSNFMLKKYSKVLRNCPIIQNALKKVIRDKIQALPKDLQRKQGQKIIQYVKQNYPSYLFQNDGQNSYILKKANTDRQISTYVQKWAGISIKKMKKSDIKVIKNKDLQGREYYLFEYNDQDWIDNKYFANPENIAQEKFGISKGNFVREATRILDQLNKFQFDMKIIESQNL